MKKILITFALLCTTLFSYSQVAKSEGKRSQTNTSLSVPLVAGDYITIKCVQPTWATNPNGTIFGGYIIIKQKLMSGD